MNRKALVSTLLGVSLAMGSVPVWATPAVVSETPAAEQAIEQVLEVYPLVEDDKELLKMAQKDVVLPGNGKFKAKLGEKELPTYTAIEKVKKIKDMQTGKEKTIYRVTTFSYASDPESTIIAPESTTDSKERYDPSYSCLSAMRAYYEGQMSRNGVTFTRISKWEGKYQIVDSQVSADQPVVWSEANGETYDYEMISNAHKEAPMSSQGTYYSLIPYWYDEYVCETTMFGQEGGTHMWLERGGSRWEFEVRLTYGTP